MAYSSTIPQAGDLLSQSQNDMLNNFAAIGTVMAVNHKPFNDGAQGKHKFLQIPEEAAAPATAANEGGLYCKESPSTATTALFFRNESSGDEVELTGAKKAVDGWVYFPSGIIMMWGTVIVGATTSAVATYVVGAGIPVLTTAYNVQLTMDGGALDTGTVYEKLLTNTAVTVQNTGNGPRTVYYTVIGV